VFVVVKAEKGKTVWVVEKDKKQSTKHYTENKRSSNTNPTINRE
jgi:uncharacterized protein (DUF2249 family)